MTQLDTLKKDVRAAFAVAVVQVRDEVFGDAGGTIEEAIEILQNEPRYRDVVAAMVPYLTIKGLHAEVKRVLNEVTDPDIGARWAYPVPLGGPNFQYVRFENMTLEQFKAWHEMVEDRVGRIVRLLEVADRVVDPLRPLLAENPGMTIGEAQRQKLASKKTTAKAVI